MKQNRRAAAPRKLSNQTKTESVMAALINRGVEKEVNVGSPKVGSKKATSKVHRLPNRSEVNMTAKKSLKNSKRAAAKKPVAKKAKAAKRDLTMPANAESKHIHVLVRDPNKRGVSKKIFNLYRNGNITVAQYRERAVKARIPVQKITRYLLDDRNRGVIELR